MAAKRGIQDRGIRRQTAGLTPWFLGLVMPLLFTFCGHEHPEARYKVFRYNQAQGLTTLDPAQARNQAIQWATTQLFQGLVELDSTLEVRPCLATDWSISPDGRTYTFRIRSGVRFHDDACFAKGQGRRVVASDFVYAFRRILDSTASRPSSGAWVFRDKVLRAEDGRISDTCFVARGDSLFVVHLERPTAHFLEVLSMPYAFVVPREAVEYYGDDFGTHPIGTGPFQFQVWEDMEKLILARNNTYWRKDEKGNSLPYLDAVEISFLSDKNQAFRLMLAGEFDLITGIEEGTRDQILNGDGTFRDRITAKLHAEKIPYLNTEYIGFQLDPKAPAYKDKTNHPLLDSRIRQALSLGLDRSRLIAGGRNGLGLPGRHGIVPPAVPGFGRAEVAGYPFDLERAKTLLAEAGYPGGKGFPKLTLSLQPPQLAFGELIQKEWRENLGIRVELEPAEQAVQIDLAIQGRVELFYGSWLGDYPDAENYLSLLYGGNAAPKGPNRTRYRNLRFDQLFEKAAATSVPAKRQALYRQLDEMAMRDAPLIPIFYDQQVRLTPKYVIGLEVNAMNVLRLERVDFVGEGWNGAHAPAVSYVRD